ncbi:3739d150-4cb6-4a5b-a5c5-da150d8b04ad [Sclerotinia trifoliorum]|uniref:3739d150-4cb6-4a5b-a5c5-da150d8b04ad n=1 Tax=Sclerotinia trifoliorum TaxID=28548 RepID=A0A8H2ZL22_9HELO|nr:3739d150-4cb6-4a5b-a5c5-da150d8b04ad [Sclerotinia trifoliorum]
MEMTPPNKDANELDPKMGLSELVEFLRKKTSGVRTRHKRAVLLDAIFPFCCGYIKDALQKPQKESKEALVRVWETFTEVAKNVEWNDPFHDKLICLLLWTKEFDVLRKSLRPQERKTSSACDCDHLLGVMQNSWEELVFATHDTLTEQCNLASFTATALAIGTNDWIGITALWYLGEALETSDEKTMRLAPVTIIWIRTAGPKLLTFSMLKKKWSNQEIDQKALIDVAWIQIPGKLAQEGGVTYHGFSLERWMFWKSRFGMFAQDEDEEVRLWATDTVEYMTEFDSMLGYNMADEAKDESESLNVLRDKDENVKPSKYIDMVD